MHVGSEVGQVEIFLFSARRIGKHTVFGNRLADILSNLGRELQEHSEGVVENAKVLSVNFVTGVKWMERQTTHQSD